MEGRPLDDDADLIRRTCAGDLRAYDQLVTRYQDVAVRVAHAMTGSDDAHDVVQEAFVKAWRALPRFRQDAAFRPWLLRIVANEARNARRGAGRRVRLALRASEDRPSAGAAPSTEETVLIAERRRVVLAAVESLREADRDVISCRYFVGLSETETADVLHCRPGTVKSRLARARARLRVALDAVSDLTSSDGARHG